ncbi:hypothetical protein EZS27_020343, partial [termite gut metagenome]
EKVIYFTASPLNPDKSNRQGAFLNVNKLLNENKFEVVRGKYLTKIIQCPNCNYAISRPEEKKTDVNVAIRMIGEDEKKNKMLFQKRRDAHIIHTCTNASSEWNINYT